MKIYLASKSPRRQALLQQMEVAFEVLALDTPEIVAPHEAPEVYSRRIVHEKLEAAWKKIITENREPRPILCADTEVIVEGVILGKPRDAHDALRMIQSYAGKTHTVLTSFGLRFQNYQKIELSKTMVTFAHITELEIQHYLNSGNYQDKAGGYGIQSYIGQFIARIEGCFYSVMGLPLNQVRIMLQDFVGQR